MRVVFLTRRFYPDIGGVEKHVLEIGKLLVKEGHKVLVITESAGDEREIDGIEIKRIKAPDNWFKKFYIWIWLLRKRRYLRIADVVHAHDVYFWYFPFRFIYPTKPNYITFHGYENYPIPNGAIKIRNLSNKFSNGSIIVGKFIEKWYRTKTDYITYGGVNLPKSVYRSSNKLSALFVGRLEKNTGILEYAKVIREIRNTYPDLEFTIIGAGNLSDKLTDFKVLQPTEDIERYINKSNFLFSSGYLTILEGLVSKRNIFAVYDNPLKKDYLEMTPFKNFINIADSSEELAKQIKSQIDKTDSKIGKGYDWARKQTWGEVYSLYKKLWKTQ